MNDEGHLHCMHTCPFGIALRCEAMQRADVAGSARECSMNEK
jgi:hypothetical protein